MYSQEYLNIPLDESLAYFKRSDFKDFSDQDREFLGKPEWKKHHNIYIGTDLAVSVKEVADWSVFVVGAVDETGYLKIIKVIRERMDSREIVETIISLQNAYDPVCISMEKGQIEKSIGPFLRERMLETNTFPTILAIAPSQDKMTRGRSIQARMRAGTVKFDKQADWYFDLEDECVLFPRGKHDDQVDALSYVGLILDKMIAGKTQQEVRQEEYDEELEQSGHYEQGRCETTGY